MDLFYDKAWVCDGLAAIVFRTDEPVSLDCPDSAGNKLGGIVDVAGLERRPAVGASDGHSGVGRVQRFGGCDFGIRWERLKLRCDRQDLVGVTWCGLLQSASVLSVLSVLVPSIGVIWITDILLCGAIKVGSERFGSKVDILSRDAHIGLLGDTGSEAVNAVGECFGGC